MHGDQGASTEIALEPKGISVTQKVGQMDLQDAGIASPNHSTKSGSCIVSQTSTVEYCQIPFEEFSSQVKELCKHLWKTQTRQADSDDSTSWSDDQLAGLPVPVGPMERPPVDAGSELDSKEFILEKMSGGGFNRVSGIDIVDSKATSANLIRLILRVPRFEHARPDQHVAILHFVRKYTSIPIPDVVMYDFTNENPLNKPYVVQSRIPGHNLQCNPSPNYYPNLNHQQKCTVAREFGRILREMQTVEHTSAGLIEAASGNKGCQDFFVHYLDISTGSGSEPEPDLNKKLPFFQPRLYGVTADATDDSSIQSTEYELSTYYFFLIQFGRWRALELRIDPALIGGWWQYYERLATMAKQMNDLDLLGDGKYCLCHLDLNTAPRNIMAEIEANDNLTITGIIDWDSAMFAPRFVGCVPPMWIWAWADEGEEDEFHANDTPATPEQQELKQIFEDAVGPTFLELAYRRAYRLARKLFQFAIDGIRASHEFEEVEELLAEWANMYEIYTADKYYSDEHSEKGSENGGAEENETTKELGELETGSNFGGSEGLP